MFIATTLTRRLKGKKLTFILLKNLLSFLAAQSSILNRTIKKVLKKEKPDTKVRPCCKSVSWKDGKPTLTIFDLVLSGFSTMVTHLVLWSQVITQSSWRSLTMMDSRWKLSLLTRPRREGPCTTWRPIWCLTSTGTDCWSAYLFTHHPGIVD